MSLIVNKDTDTNPFSHCHFWVQRNLQMTKNNNVIMLTLIAYYEILHDEIIK